MGRTQKYDDDEEEFENSDQSGGEDQDVSENPSLEIDPDDEKEYDTNEDEKFDPINEGDEPEDGPETDQEEPEHDQDQEETEDDEGIRQCYMKKAKKSKDVIIIDEDDSNAYGKLEYKRINDDDRTTDSVMSYYEMVRIIGTRAQQFNFGAEPLVEGLEGQHPAKMAYVELLSKMTPFIIRRHLPGKKYEEWRVDELDIVHPITDEFFVPDNFELIQKSLQYGEKMNNTMRNSK